MAEDRFKYFRIEARELLESIGKDMLALENEGATVPVVARLLRLAHTLKGAARVVRLKEIADRAHALEDALVPLRDGAGPLAREVVSGMLAEVDAMTRGLAALDAPAPAAEPTAAPRPALDETTRIVRSDQEEVERLSEGLAEASGQLASIRSAAGLWERALRTAERLASALDRRSLEGSKPEAARLEVMAHELCDLLVKGERDLRGGTEQIERELQQARETADRLRLVPVKAVLATLERAARDAAASLDKRVELSASGGDLRVEVEVLGAVQAALVQAVRNAVAHGIETPAERVAAGKPPVGRLSLDVGLQGRRIRFVCRDDGRGVDLRAVAQSARRRGLLPGGGAEPAPAELLQLLLQGGISTAAAVNEVAGRGVGLDVIREVATRVGGEVALRSHPGRGTELELVVPLSLSALDVLVVEAGGQIVNLPLHAVRQALQIRTADLHRTKSGQAIELDGELVPFARLGSLLAGGGPRSGPAASCPAVIVESEGRRAALGLDRLLGNENVVTRPLPAEVPPEPVVAGAALDVAGNPRLVLDGAGLIAWVLQEQPAVVAAPALRPPILVVDDSLTTRMLEQSILESAGYEVDLAASGEEGLEKARQRRYGLFLVDVEMPGIDGFTFIERSRADHRLADVPAILVTSRANPEDLRRGESVGARAYVIKSQFNQAQLLEQIRGLVG